MEIQRGRSADALGLADELVNIGDKLREGSEAPFARVLRSLAAYLNGERDESASLDAALRDLRAADAKHRLAYALTRAAEEDLRNGVADRAKERSSEALAIARALGQPSEIALAHIVLARAASAAGDDATLKRQLTDLATESLRGVSAEVREILESLLTGAGGRLDDR
ncbi:MAG: hypothetical protein KC466_16245 [Myxococcales bacterium]|nr:hypothetical protein [Myxococcales bacterium]